MASSLPGFPAKRLQFFLVSRPAGLEHILDNYPITVPELKMDGEVKYRTSGPHSSFMALLPTQPAVYLHVNLIIWALACGLEFPAL